MLGLIENYILSCVERGLSKKTYGSYEQTLLLFRRYLIEECGIDKFSNVKKKHVQDYVDFLKQRGKYTLVSNDNTLKSNSPQNRKDYGKRISEITINNYLRNLNAFFNWCHEYGHIKENPMKDIKLIKTERKPLHFISDSDFKMLLNSMNLSKFSEYRDYVIIQLLLDSGMRIGEALMIKIGDVNFKDCSIYLPAENTKGKRGRYVFFSEKVSKLLRRWIQYQDRYRDTVYLFCTNKGKKLEIGTFETNLSKYAKRIQLTDIHPHVFRNNFAKRYLMNGGDIFTLSRILGHSDVKVTENAYLDLDTTDLMKKYRACSPISNMKL